MSRKLWFATVALLCAGVAGAQPLLTLTPTTAQALRTDAYNFAGCAWMVHVRSDAPFKNNAELQKQAELAATASIELSNWLQLLKDGEALVPPTRKFTRAQLAAASGVARAAEAAADFQQRVRAGGENYYNRELAVCTSTVFLRQVPIALKFLKAAQSEGAA
jgi:hypothetical protein